MVDAAQLLVAALTAVAAQRRKCQGQVAASSSAGCGAARLREGVGTDRKSMEILSFNGDLMGFHGGVLEFHAGLMGFHGGLMGAKMV